ncbi:hypothetical protein ACIO14_20620 [Nocardia fluminea]|uniref:hypothetical protein n=1 Tax=Nocardia fluminea TaxID=134984 RepID=UPI00381E94AE
MASTRSSGQRRAGVPAPSVPPGELIVVTTPTGPEITPIALRENRSVRTRVDELLPATARLVPIFGPDNRLAARLADTPQALVAGEYLSYYSVHGDLGDLAELAHRLRADDTVAAAYVKPAAELPLAPLAENIVAPRAPVVTPDFRVRQAYLDSAPHGIDAVWAHGQPGGLGTGVRVIDVEGAWQFTHEDLRHNQGGIIGGTVSADLGWRNHTPRAGAAKSPPPATVTCKAVPTRTSGTPTNSAAPPARPRSSSAPSPPTRAFAPETRAARAPTRSAPCSAPPAPSKPRPPAVPRPSASAPCPICAP